MRLRKKRYDVERGLISKLLQDKDFNFVQEQQIKNSFFSGDSYYVYRFIEEYFLKHSNIPTLRVVEQKFPQYEFDTIEIDGFAQIGTDEPLSHWCDEVRKKAKHNYMADMVDAMVDNLNKLGTEKAYEELKKGLYHIENEVQLNTDIDITKDSHKRKEVYLKRKETKGMLGISYGLSRLDYITKGMENKTLTTVIAKTGYGKTWFQVLVGAYAMLHNYRVLQGVTEMSEEIMRDRYDAVLYGMMCGDLNYSNFKSGSLSIEQERGYFRFLEEELPCLEPLILFTATDVSSVQAKAESVKADLILLDGVYLMRDQRGAKDDWLRVAHITRDLKLMAKNLSRPVMINTQADKITSKTGPELDNIMFTQAIGQDSDTVLALYCDEIMRNDKEMGIKVLKQREGMLGKCLINWNFQVMDFSEIYSVVEGDENSKVEEKPDNIIGLGSRRKTT